MKIESLHAEGEKLSFTLSDVGVCFANAIRRTLLNSIPVYAIDKVVFYENTSSFFDEYISNRLALIPLTTPPNEAPSGEGVLLTLDAEGPRVVYSKDMTTSDPRIAPAYKNIPIIKLAEGQRLRLEAKARMGTAREHAKFQACLASYEQTKENSFNFKIETFGNLTPKELMLKAAETLQEKCDEALKQLKQK